jgi:hypothetical protein
MDGKRLQRSKRFIVIYIYFLFALRSLRRVLFGDIQLTDLPISLALSAAMVKFCAVDSKCRGEPLLHSFYWIIFFTWPVSVPIYLLWSRGIRGIVSLVLYVISLVVMFFIVFVVTYYLVWD